MHQCCFINKLYSIYIWIIFFNKLNKISPLHFQAAFQLGHEDALTWNSMKVNILFKISASHFKGNYYAHFLSRWFGRDLKYCSRIFTFPLHIWCLINSKFPNLVDLFSSCTRIRPILRTNYTLHFSLISSDSKSNIENKLSLTHS